MSTAPSLFYCPCGPKRPHGWSRRIRLPQPEYYRPIGSSTRNGTKGSDPSTSCYDLGPRVCDILTSSSRRSFTKFLYSVFYRLYRLILHSGRFRNGSNSGARYHPQVLSSLAKEAGHPIVLVQINYRLGIFGFGASSDLASEYGSTTSKPSFPLPNQPPDYFGNFGFVDQRNAFEWVQNHIQDFGGDPFNVTAFGVSAGSGSLHLHILSGKPLFDRAILMSGSAPIMGPLPLEYLEAGWTNLCRNSGVLSETCEKRLEKLRSLSPDELIQKYGPNATLPPLADGKLLPTSWRLGELHPNSRCKDIIIGNTRVEAIIFDSLSRHLLQNSFHEKVLAAFATASDADLFCKYFGFTLSEEQPFEAYRDAMRFFLSVVLFHFPGLRVTESYGGNAYLYHFEEPSPYAGPTHGLPVHGQCAVFVHNNERKVWPESAQRISLEMANLWTAFAYGKEPWEPYPVAKRFMRFGPFGKCSMRSFEDDEMRDYGYLNWLREHFEEALALVLSLM